MSTQEGVSLSEISGLDDEILMLDQHGSPMKLRTLRQAFMEGRVQPRRRPDGTFVADQVTQPSGYYRGARRSDFVEFSGGGTLCFMITANAYAYMTEIMERALEDAENGADEAVS